MSAVDAKRSWLALINESEDDKLYKKDSSTEKESRAHTSGRKRVKPNNKNESDKSSGPPKKPLQLETDPLVLQRRQKQIDYGKNTVGYHSYVQQVPMDKRTKEHPRTPDKYTKYSRRSWDTLIKMWRVKLHEYDTEAASQYDHDDEDYLVEDD